MATPNGHSGHCSNLEISGVPDAVDSPVDVALTQWVTSLLYHLTGSILPHPPDASFWQEIQDV